MAAQLILATTRDLNDMEELLTQQLGHSIPILLLVQTKLRYSKISDQLIYIPSAGKYQRSIIIITKASNVIKPSRQALTVWWDVDTVSDDNLRDFLLVIPEWNWNEPYELECTPNPFGSKLCEIFSEDEFSGKNLHGLIHGGILMTLRKEDIPHLSLPRGFKKSKLYPCHMSFVFRTWYWSKFQDYNFFRNAIEFLPSVAIFKEEDDVMTSNPVSFVQLYKFGFIGVLITDEKYRNLGLASYVEVELAKLIIDEGIIAAVWIMEENDSSIKFHLKNGFRRIANGSGCTTPFVDKSITMKDWHSVNSVA